MNKTKYFIIYCNHCKQLQKIWTKKDYPSGSRNCVYCGKRVNLNKHNIRMEIKN